MILRFSFLLRGPPPHYWKNKSYFIKISFWLQTPWIILLRQVFMFSLPIECKSHFVFLTTKTLWRHTYTDFKNVLHTSSQKMVKCRKSLINTLQILAWWGKYFIEFILYYKYLTPCWPPGKKSDAIKSSMKRNLYFNMQCEVNVWTHLNSLFHIKT